MGSLERLGVGGGEGDRDSRSFLPFAGGGCPPPVGRRQSLFSPMPVTFRHATLSNGLQIVAETDPKAHTAAVGFFVKTGARDEDSAVMGVSHFLEHMMFKGTARRTADQVNHEFDAMGAKANAYTSGEMTAFYASVLPEMLPKATDLLADMMRPALRDEDFNTEKGVILEEIAMYADEPIWVLHDAMGEQHFMNQPLGHRVLGTTQTITDLRAEQMRAYFQSRYSADNTIVALTGKVDFEAAVAHLDKLCGHWQRTDARRVYPSGTGVHAKPGMSFEVEDDKVTRAYRLMTCPGPASDDPARYAAFVAAQILGDDGNSRLHWSLVETGIADEAEASFEPMDKVGLFRVLVATDAEKLEAAWQIANKQMADLSASLTEKDVEMVRSKVATGIVVAGERPEGRMHRLGRQYLYLGAYSSLDEELARVNAVTVAQVRELLAKYPLAGTVGTLKPKG